LQRLTEVKHATVIALVYRAKVHGHVGVRLNGLPNMKLYIPDYEAHVVNRGLRTAARALLEIGARYVHTGVPGAVEEMRTEADTDSLLNKDLKAKHLQNTLTHVFGSCRMSAKDGAVDERGRVRDVEGLYVTDASLFPSPSAVNPQATIMALSDIISRRLAERSLG
jgi:choline dehydrogenase-like flavoprotein